MPVPVFADQPTHVLTRSAAGRGQLFDADLPYVPTSQVDEAPLLRIPTAKSRPGQLPVDYVNPVPNAGVGNGTAGWASAGGAISATTTDGTPDGIGNAVRMNTTYSAGGCWICPISGGGSTRTVPQLVDSGARSGSGGQTFNMRFWVKRDHALGTHEEWRMRLYCWKSDGTWNADFDMGPITTPTQGVWTLVTGSATIPANTAFCIGACRVGRTDIGGALDWSMTAYVDGVAATPPDAVNGALNNAIFVGTANQSPSVRLNPIYMNPIPGPRGTVGWSAYQGGSVSTTHSYADSPDLGADGTCFRVTMASTGDTNPLLLNPTLGDSASGTTSPGTLNSKGFARVQSGGSYTARCWVRSASAAVTSIQLRAYYRNASGTWISAQVSPTLISAPSVNNWYLLQYTFTAPAGAAWATFWPSANAPAGSAHDFRATYAWHGAGTVASYVDGAMPGGIWRGTAHNSASYRLI